MDKPLVRNSLVALVAIVVVAIYVLQADIVNFQGSDVVAKSGNTTTLEAKHAYNNSSQNSWLIGRPNAVGGLKNSSTPTNSSVGLGQNPATQPPQDPQAVSQSRNFSLNESQYPYEPNGYLQFFTQGGWSNQILCIENMFYLARATNRILVLPPLLPHFFSHHRDVYDDDKGEFKEGFDLASFLLKLGPERYNRLDQILDVSSALPGIQVIDFKEFHQKFQPSKESSWKVDFTYSHYNTQWIRNVPELMGKGIEVKRREHNHDRIYTQTYRDVSEVRDNPDLSSKLVWTVLDSFRDNLHSSVRHSPNFHTRYNKSIRNICKLIHNQDWQGIPYASMHLRGSDGPFKKEEHLLNAIDTAFDTMSLNMRQWMAERQNVSSSTGSFAQDLQVGLFIATDLDRIRENKKFATRMSQLVTDIQEASSVSVDLKVWYSFETRSRIEQLSRNVTNLGTDPTIFFDQQLAACGEIGFARTPGSTFSDLIQSLRLDMSFGCDFKNGLSH